MQRVGENYKKIRNTFRYILSNLYDFDPAKDAVAFEKMEELDQYMLRQTSAFAGDVKNSYDEFAFHKIYQRVNNFCIVDLSAFYFDVLKDRLYISASKVAGTSLGANGGVAYRRSACALACADHDIHMRRSLEISAEN